MFVNVLSYGESENSGVLKTPVNFSEKSFMHWKCIIFAPYSNLKGKNNEMSYM